jgi:hypothetical protein
MGLVRVADAAEHALEAVDIDNGIAGEPGRGGGEVHPVVAV